MVLLHLDALTQWSTLLGAIRTAVPCQMLWPTLPVCFGRISQTPSASAKNNEASLSHRDAGADSFPCFIPKRQTQFFQIIPNLTAPPSYFRDVSWTEYSELRLFYNEVWE